MLSLNVFSRLKLHSTWFMDFIIREDISLLTSKQSRASKEICCLPENTQKVKIRSAQVLGAWRDIVKEMVLDGFLDVHA